MYHATSFKSSRLWLGLLLLFFSFQAAAQDAETTYAERLGWPKGAKVVIFHIDDAGMHHDANVGTIEALENGVTTSASIMFPCPWVPEMVEYVKAHPGLDFGVHVTLTSEWKRYRWLPLAGKAAVPSLVDEEGCFYHEVPQVMFKAKPDDVEAEIRAQLDRCRSMGIEPTHLDSHMGTVFATFPFFERYMKVGAENGIPVMVPGGHMNSFGSRTPLLVPTARMAGQKTWDAGLPVLDDLYSGDYEEEHKRDKKGEIIAFLRNLKPGLTQFIVHCTRPSEVFGKISGSGGTRLAELEAVTDPEVRKVVEEEGIILTTWRELKERRDKAGK